MMPRRMAVAGLALAPLLVVAACASPGPTPSERAIVQAWLECGECRSGERDAVRALGQRAVPLLTDALENGPPALNRDNMRRKFTRVYATIAAAKAPAVLAVSETAYVNPAVANFVATYQKRAALSLRDIGGPDAASAFQAVLGSGTLYHADVLNAVRLSAGPDFEGTVKPKTLKFGDTVEVLPPPAQLFDGNEWANVEGFDIPDASMMLLSTPDRLRFLIAGGNGQQVLAVHNVGTSTDTQRTSVVISSLADLNDRSMSSCTTLTCRINAAPRYVSVAAPFQWMLSLWHSTNSKDTLDIIKFEPAAALHVTASLRWSPSANLDLRWIDCTTHAPVGNADGATQSSMPETTTVDIPAGDCWALLVLLKHVGNVPLVAAALRITP